MRRITTATIAVILGMGLALTAAAQGRHDEKPHGSTKPSVSSTEGLAPIAIAGGRHDERPHGARKPAAIKQSEKVEGAAATDAGKVAK
jgi:hypothetical protein